VRVTSTVLAHSKSMDSGPLFRKSTIPTNPKAYPKADPNPNLNTNVTVRCICTMDFRNSDPVPVNELTKVKIPPGSICCGLVVKQTIQKVVQRA